MKVIKQKVVAVCRATENFDKAIIELAWVSNVMFTTMSLTDIMKVPFVTVKESMPDETFQKLHPDNVWERAGELGLREDLILFWGELAPERIKELKRYEKIQKAIDYYKLCKKRGVKPFIKENFFKEHDCIQMSVPELKDEAVKLQEFLQEMEEPKDTVTGEPVAMTHCGHMVQSKMMKRKYHYK